MLSVALPSFDCYVTAGPILALSLKGKCWFKLSRLLGSKTRAYLVCTDDAVWTAVSWVTHFLVHTGPCSLDNSNHAQGVQSVTSTYYGSLKYQCPSLRLYKLVTVPRSIIG